MFAGTIFHVANALENSDLFCYNTQVEAGFIQHRHNDIPTSDFSIPRFDHALVEPPKLGPLLKLDESPMERFSRAYTAVPYLLFQTTKSKYMSMKSKIVKHNYFVSTIVTEGRLPLWKTKEATVETPSAAAILQLISSQKLKPQHVTLQFVREDGTDDDELLTVHIDTVLRRKKIYMMAETIEYKHDIREFEVAS